MEKALVDRMIEGRSNTQSEKQLLARWTMPNFMEKALTDRMIGQSNTQSEKQLLARWTTPNFMEKALVDQMIEGRSNIQSEKQLLARWTHAELHGEGPCRSNDRRTK